MRREKKRSEARLETAPISRRARGDRVRVGSGTKNRLKRSQKKRGRNRDLENGTNLVVFLLESL